MDEDKHELQRRSSPDSGGDLSRRRRTRAGDDERDRVVSALSEALGRGQLTLDEFDERQSLALRAVYIDQLPEVIEDIPQARELEEELRAVDGDARGAGSTPGGGASAAGTSLSPRAGAIPPARPGSGERKSQVAILSGSRVIVEAGAPAVDVYSVMAGNDYDLTEVMGPGVEFTINTYSLMAGHDIYVPAGVRVIDDTFNFLAGNDIAQAAQGDGSNGTLILKGVQVMAGNDVKLAPGARNQLT